MAVYCVCRQSYDIDRFMIECDSCKDWFHGSCVKVEEHYAADIDLYHCPNCEPIHGPSRMKKHNNFHRHDYTEVDDETRPVQAGTLVFIQQLQARTFPSADEIVLKMTGDQVTQGFLEKDGFHYPIVVPDWEGLGLKVPPLSFTVRDVEHYVGGDKVIDVIDVARQADSKMNLSEFVKYYYQPERPKVLNLISLEFSDTKMAELVEVPDIARRISWVENYWPDDSFFPKPFVQKYCLMGVKNSYTDFHIDFGGTSVWYHVLWGEKIFYLIKPTKTNLALYESWSSSANQSEVFFGDKVEKCYKCVVKPGTTVLLPTGWIHAVFTSQDCMAFGGNFLHNLNIGMQLRCYEMERRLKTPELFKFPYFEAISWYVANNLRDTLRELREDKREPQSFLVDGVRALISALKTWLRRELTEPNSEVPDNIRPTLLIKELRKEIRHLEENSGNSVKSQGILESWSTRSSLERRSQARRAARRLRDLCRHRRHHHRHHRHHHQHISKSPSNLDILELHTREVLRRLEVGTLDPGSDFSSKINRKLKKIFTTSAVMMDSHDNALRLVLCNGRIIRERRSLGVSLKHKRKTSLCQQHIKTEKSLSYQQNIKTESVEARLERQCIAGHKKSTNHKLRMEQRDSGSDLRSDKDEAVEVRVTEGTLKKYSLGSGGFEEESEHVRHKKQSSVHCVTSKSPNQHQKPLKRERLTSPSVETGLRGAPCKSALMHQKVSKDGAVSQEAWWSTHTSRSSGNEVEIPDGETGSMSSAARPLHPTKKHSLTHTQSPINNQATKGKRPKKGLVPGEQRLEKLLKITSHTRLLL